jgi:uncharacterized membrane protein HdeD (DUF308 family)
MAVATDTSPGFGELRGRWGWFAAFGVLLMIAGFIALMSVVLATVVSVLVVGFMMIVSGVVEIVHGFQMKRWSRFFMWVLIGVFYLIAGLIVVWNPLLASVALTLALGIFLLIAGIIRIVLATQMRGDSPWGWVLLSGIITLLLGLIIIIHWPVSSLFVLGIFLGVDLMIAGASWLGAALALRRTA